jgi:hypothetical protein
MGNIIRRKSAFAKDLCVFCMFPAWAVGKRWANKNGFFLFPFNLNDADGKDSSAFRTCVYLEEKHFFLLPLKADGRRHHDQSKTNQFKKKN